MRKPPRAGERLGPQFLGKAGEREKKDKEDGACPACQSLQVSWREGWWENHFLLSLINFSVGWIKATPNGAGHVSLSLEIIWWGPKSSGRWCHFCPRCCEADGFNLLHKTY